MEVYNTKDFLRIIFQFHRSDTIRSLFPLLLAVSAYAGLIAWWELEYLKLPDDSWVRNIPTMHSLLGFVISMLLVFRTNTAYDRWWEGRKLWGSLVNNSRNLAIKIHAMTEDASSRQFFRKAIPLYAKVLKAHLRSEETRLALDEKEHPEFRQIDTRKHVPNQVASMIMDRVMRMHRESRISGDQLIVLNAELQSFTDICGACERIKNTPIPYSYSSFIKKFIFMYVLTLPFGFVFSMGYYVIALTAFVFYVLASLELIAEEIEEPFGVDPMDLPMDKIAANIEKHIAEIL